MPRANSAVDCRLRSFLSQSRTTTLMTLRSAPAQAPTTKKPPQHKAIGTPDVPPPFPCPEAPERLALRHSCTRPTPRPTWLLRAFPCSPGRGGRAGPPGPAAAPPFCASGSAPSPRAQDGCGAASQERNGEIRSRSHPPPPRERRGHF